jgi:HK97 family phage major capsid protein
LVLQSSLDVENFVRNDLAMTLALAIEKKALYGNTAFAAAEPTGIANTASINTIDIPANTPTYANVVAMEAAVETYNALLGNLAYLTAPGVKGNMKVTSIDSGSGRFIWEGNQVNGYRAEASSTVTAGDIFFGNWADLVIGMWGGLDITVDPYALATSGGVRVIALQSVDVGVRHSRSFVYGV